MKHSDELKPQPAVRRDQFSGAGSISFSDTVTAAEATHNRSRVELVRAFEAMKAAGFVTTAPAAPTTGVTDAVAASAGELR